MCQIACASVRDFTTDKAFPFIFDAAAPCLMNAGTIPDSIQTDRLQSLTCRRRRSPELVMMVCLPPGSSEWTVSQIDRRSVLIILAARNGRIDPRTLPAALAGSLLAKL